MYKDLKKMITCNVYLNIEMILAGIHDVFYYLYILFF